MKEIVIFDIDNTILEGLSQSHFVDYLYRTDRVGFIYKFLITIWVIFYKIGFIKNPRPAMEYALSFIKGKNEDDIRKLTNSFFNEYLAYRIYPDVKKIIKDHQNLGREIIFVSNAPDIVVKVIAEYFNIKRFVCTRLEKVDGIYTGKIIGEIMYGMQKINSINSYIEMEGLTLENSWGYGDHDSDQYILSEVSYPHAVNPTKGLMKIAEKNDWPILKFKL